MKAAFKYIGLYLLMSISGYVLFLIPAAFVWGALGAKGSFFDNQLVEDFAFMGSQLFCIYFFSQLKYCNYWIGREIHSSNLYLWLTVGCIGLMLLDVVSMNYIPVPDWEFEIIEELESSMNNPFGVIATCILAPVMEEGICRGAILRRLLEKQWKPWVAIVVSALFFAVMHLNLSQGIGAFTMGLFLGWIYYRTRNLWPCIFVHALNNTLCTIDYWLFPEYDFIDALYVMLPLLAVSLVMIYLAVKNIRPMYFPLPQPVQPAVPLGETVPPPFPDEYVMHDVPVGEPLADDHETGISTVGHGTDRHTGEPEGDLSNDNHIQDS